MDNPYSDINPSLPPARPRPAPWTPFLLLVLVGTLGLSSISQTFAGTVRPSALAGAWYPGDPDRLRAKVDEMLDAARPAPVAGTIRALIVPHAGYVYSGPTAATAFDLVRGRAYDRVLILAPSHHSGFAGLSVATVDAFETPLGQVQLDLDAVSRLRRSPLFKDEPQAQAQEHAIEIELPLLQRALQPGWRLVPVLVGQLAPQDYQTAAGLLRPLADEKTLVVVSSDFTHHGPRFDYQPFPQDDQLPERLRTLDEGAIERIQAHDGPGLLDYRERTGITVCGVRPLALLLEMLPAAARVERVAYNTSGAITGDWGNSVSYAALAITAPAPLAGPRADPAPAPAATLGTAEVASPLASSAGESALSGDDLQRLHRLAVLGIQAAVLGDSDARAQALRTEVAALPERLKSPAGAFVTLKRHGDLRGCIGYIRGVKPLYQAVLENGINAAKNDYRFNPVEPKELEGLDVEVSVLSPLTPIASWDEFKVGEQGITLTKDGHAAVFLPEVATEQGWDREQTLTNLARKAGLPADAWRQGASFEVFTSTQYKAQFLAASP